VSPPRRCHPTPFLPVQPRFSTILCKFAHTVFFPSGVTPMEGVTRGGLPAPWWRHWSDTANGLLDLCFHTFICIDVIVVAGYFCLEPLRKHCYIARSRIHTLPLDLPSIYMRRLRCSDMRRRSLLFMACEIERRIDDYLALALAAPSGLASTQPYRFCSLTDQSGADGSSPWPAENTLIILWKSSFTDTKETREQYYQHAL